MQSNATTVQKYLAELPPDRRAAISAVRNAVLAALPAGYEEGMQYGMIGWYVPHSAFPAGYHCDPKQPLPFVCLASQKNYMSLYLGSVYGSAESAEKFQAAWAKTGKKLDMGKSCIRFKKVEDLALDVITDAIKRMPVKKWIAVYEAARAQPPMKREEIAARTKAKKQAAVKSRGGAKKMAKKTPTKSVPRKAASRKK
jgi:hypothetical protein